MTVTAAEQTANQRAGTRQAAPKETREWTSAEVRELCRVLRAELTAEPGSRAGRLPARVAHLPAAQVRRWLVTVADAAVRAGTLAGRARDAWVVAEGLTGRCHRRWDVAAALGVSPSRVDQLRERAISAVAAAAGAVVALPSPASATPLPAEWALARLHAEIASTEPGDPASDDAVHALRADVIAGLPRPRGAAPATDAARAARSRRRRRLEGQLRQLRVAPVRLPLRMLTGGSGADVGELGAWLDEAERLVTDDPAASRELTERICRRYAAFETPPDPAAESRAWRLAVRHDLHHRNMAAFWKAQRVARLAGPSAPHTVEAVADAAVVLRANGYLYPASRLLGTLLRDMPRLGADAARRAQLTATVLGAYGSATPWSPAGVLPRHALEETALRTRQHLRLLETGPYEASLDDWLTVRRRQLLSENAAASARARDDGIRRARWSASFERRVAALADESASGGAESRLFTALTMTRLHGDRGDGEAFAAWFGDFLDLWGRELPHYSLHAEEHGFRARAARAGWRELLVE